MVLAAGAGTRLRPLTALRPKALCPVGTVPLLDLALARLMPLAGGLPGDLAVNAHEHAFAPAVAAHVAGRAHVSVEHGEALGTAGALGALRPWLDGRGVAVTNADAYLPGGLAGFAEGWDGARSRLLCRPVPGDGDFASVRPGLEYVGACLLPWASVARFEATPSGLYEVLWRHEARSGALELVTLAEAGAGDVAIDCGTPATTSLRTWCRPAARAWWTRRRWSRGDRAVRRVGRRVRRPRRVPGRRRSRGDARRARDRARAVTPVPGLRRGPPSQLILRR